MIVIFQCPHVTVEADKTGETLVTMGAYVETTTAEGTAAPLQRLAVCDCSLAFAKTETLRRRPRKPVGDSFRSRPPKNPVDPRTVYVPRYTFADWEGDKPGKARRGARKHKLTFE